MQECCEFLVEVAGEEGEEGDEGEEDVGYEGGGDGGEGGGEAGGGVIQGDGGGWVECRYIRPTATSRTLSRRAKFVKLSHAEDARVRTPCSASERYCCVESSRRGIVYVS